MKVTTAFYSTFIHCPNSDIMIGCFVPRDKGLYRACSIEKTRACRCQDL